MSLSRKAAIVGIAHLPFSKNIGTPERTNAMRVTMQALDDAGLRPEDVDGIAAPAVELDEWGGWVWINMAGDDAVPLAEGLGAEIMADLGADVIRVENESYLDSMRNGMQVYPDRPSLNGSGMFNNMSRNKRGVTLDLRQPDGRGLFGRLITDDEAKREAMIAGIGNKVIVAMFPFLFGGLLASVIGPLIFNLSI